MGAEIVATIAVLVTLALFKKIRVLRNLFLMEIFICLVIVTVFFFPTILEFASRVVSTEPLQLLSIFSWWGFWPDSRLFMHFLQHQALFKTMIIWLGMTTFGLLGPLMLSLLVYATIIFLGEKNKISRKKLKSNLQSKIKFAQRPVEWLSRSKMAKRTKSMIKNRFGISLSVRNPQETLTETENHKHLVILFYSLFTFIPIVGAGVTASILFAGETLDIPFRKVLFWVFLGRVIKFFFLVVPAYFLHFLLF